MLPPICQYAKWVEHYIQDIHMCIQKTIDYVNHAKNRSSQPHVKSTNYQLLPLPIHLNNYSNGPNVEASSIPRKHTYVYCAEVTHVHISTYNMFTPSVEQKD